MSNRLHGSTEVRFEFEGGLHGQGAGIGVSS